MELLKLARRSSKVTAVFLASTFLFGASVYAGGKDELIKHSENHQTAYYSHDKLLKMKKDSNRSNKLHNMVNMGLSEIAGGLDFWNIFSIVIPVFQHVAESNIEDDIERYLKISPKKRLQRCSS